jgi:hypothetical protein
LAGGDVFDAAHSGGSQRGSSGQLGASADHLPRCCAAP